VKLPNLLGQQLALGLAQTRPRRHRRAGHSSLEHRLKIVVRRNAVYGTDQSKPSGSKIPRLRKQKRGRRSVAVPFFSVATGAVLCEKRRTCWRPLRRPLDEPRFVVELRRIGLMRSFGRALLAVAADGNSATQKQTPDGKTPPPPTGSGQTGYPIRISLHDPAS
jgi:hypothetical protein